jgi:Beta-lactamase class C and other penicillin binding proteins
MTLGAYLQKNIFAPLGMVDTGFYVPAAKHGRLTAVHGYDADGKITTIPWAATPTSKPVLESGSGGLYSTLEDYFQFAQMLGNGGELGGKRILKADTIKLMRQNVLKDGVYVDLYGPNMEGVGFGLDFAVIYDPTVAKTPQGKDSFYWGGAYGTWFWVDPTNDIVFIGLIQNRNGSRTADGNPAVRATSLPPLYNALVDPRK